jgi:hypothetical protein
MRKREQILAIAGGRRMRRSAARLREWKCGDVTVAVDAALTVVVQVSGAAAAVGDVAGLIAALSAAQCLAASAEQETAAALVAQLTAAHGAVAPGRAARARARQPARPDLSAGRPAPCAGW